VEIRVRVTPKNWRQVKRNVISNLQSRLRAIVIISFVTPMGIGLARFNTVEQHTTAASLGAIAPTVSAHRLIRRSLSLSDSAYADQKEPAPSVAAPAGESQETEGVIAHPITVRFFFVANFILLPVKLNNFPQPVFLMLDTGAQNFLSPEIADKLGLRITGSYLSLGAGNRLVPSGRASIETLKIGGLTLHDQRFYVVPLPFALRQGLHPEIVGGIGYQLLRKMAVYVDYEHRKLTFYGRAKPPELHSSKQVSIPLSFHRRVPVIDGRIDGIPARFQIDTGSDTTLTLFTPFVVDHDMVRSYSPRLHGFAGEGVGGRETAFFVRTHSLEIGDRIAMHGVTAELLQDFGGIGAQQEVNGNIGGAALKQFNILFDYPQHKIYLEKNSRFGRRETFNRTGLCLRITPQGLTVMSIFQGSPAAEAGIEPGDIITAINGHGAAELDAAFLGKVLQDRPGTVMRMDLLHQGAEKNVSFRLRKILN
jgi:hypothetical protein